MKIRLEGIMRATTASEILHCLHTQTVKTGAPIMKQLVAIYALFLLNCKHIATIIFCMQYASTKSNL